MMEKKLNSVLLICLLFVSVFSFGNILAEDSSSGSSGSTNNNDKNNDKNMGNSDALNNVGGGEVPDTHSAEAGSDGKSATVTNVNDAKGENAVKVGENSEVKMEQGSKMEVKDGGKTIEAESAKEIKSGDTEIKNAKDVSVEGKDGDKTIKAESADEIKSGDTEIKNAKDVSIEEKNGEKNIEAKSLGELKIGDTTFNNIKDVNLKLSAEGKISSAKFTASKDGKYVLNSDGSTKLSTEGKDMEFTLKAGDKVDINFEKGEIKAEAQSGVVNLKYDNKEIEAKEFSLKMDGEGKFEELKLSPEGFYKDVTPEGWFKDSEVRKFSSKNELSIYFDGRDIKGEKGDAVSIKENGGIDFKGQVEYSDGASYTGLDKDTFTEYSVTEGGKKFFDVKEGDASIENDKHKIRLEDGNVRMDRKHLGESAGEKGSFDFKYGDGKNYIKGRVDEKGNALSLTAYENGKEIDSKVISFDDYDKALNKEISDNIVQKRIELEKAYKNGEVTKDDYDKIRLGLIAQMNAITSDSEQKLSNLMNLLSDIKLNSEVKVNTMMAIAEIRAAQGGKDNLDDAVTWLNQAREIAEQTGQKTTAIDLVLGQVSMKNEDWGGAISAFSRVANSDVEDSVKSNALALKSFANFNGGDYMGALKDVAGALKLDPENPTAKVLYNEYSEKIFSAAQEKLKLENEQVNEAYEIKTGVTKLGLEDTPEGFKERLKNAFTTMSPFTQAINRIDPSRIADFTSERMDAYEQMSSAAKGLQVYQDLAQKGLLSDFNKATDVSSQLDIIRKAYGLGSSSLEMETAASKWAQMHFARELVPDAKAVATFGESGKVGGNEPYYYTKANLGNLYAEGLDKVLHSELDPVNVAAFVAAPVLGAAAGVKLSSYISKAVKAIEGIPVVGKGVSTAITTVGELRAVQALRTGQSKAMGFGRFVVESGLEGAAGLTVASGAAALGVPEAGKIGVATDLFLGFGRVFNLKSTVNELWDAGKGVVNIKGANDLWLGEGVFGSNKVASQFDLVSDEMKLFHDGKPLDDLGWNGVPALKSYSEATEIFGGMKLDVTELDEIVGKYEQQMLTDKFNKQMDLFEGIIGKEFDSDLAVEALERGDYGEYFKQFEAALGRQEDTIANSLGDFYKNGDRFGGNYKDVYSLGRGDIDEIVISDMSGQGWVSTAAGGVARQVKVSSDLYGYVDGKNLGDVFHDNWMSFPEGVKGTTAVTYEGSNGNVVVGFMSETEVTSAEQAAVGLVKKYGRESSSALDSLYDGNIVDDLSQEVENVISKMYSFEIRYSEASKKIVDINVYSTITNAQQEFGVQLSREQARTHVREVLRRIDSNLLGDAYKNWKIDDSVIDKIIGDGFNFK